MAGAFLLCALCAVAHVWSEPEGEPSTPLWAKTVLAAWMLTLPITILFASVSGMAADGGYHPSVYIFMGAAFTYPISIVLAISFRRKFPLLVLLPCLNVVVWFISGS
jgi:hypothetical protein